MEEFEKASCIRGFYVYQNNWTPILGERPVCKNEPGNPRDRYAVAVCKAGDEIMGHLPRNIPTTCSDRTRAWSAIRHFNPRPYDKKEKIRWKTFAIGG